MVVQLASNQRRRLDQILQLTVPGLRGPVPLSELVRVQEGRENAAIFHENLMPVSYVFGDLAGAIESPVYALSALNKKIDAIKGTGGKPVARLGLAHPGKHREPGDEVGRRVAHHPGGVQGSGAGLRRRCWC